MSRLQSLDAEQRRASGRGPDHSEALARGLSVLTSFNAGRRVQTLSELAEAVGLPRATARRALLTLAALGYVSAEGRQFRLTPRVLRLAAAYLTSNAVSVLLQPACDRIARHVAASCTAAVLEQDEVVMIARALPAQLVPVGAGVGFRLPAYCSALGRVLLADLPRPALDAYLVRTPLLPVTPFTQTDPDAIRAAIQSVDERGYCLVDQEAEHGFRSVAVAVRKFDGTLAAALNIGARVEQADAATMTGRFVDVLRKEASELSDFLV